MDDLISRSAALDALEWKWAGKAAIDAIKNLPSAQPEIIECKDCEHWYTEEDDDDQYGYCRNHDFWTFDIWFCADGERRRR